jgi:uncharacterized protein YbjT (DUF2867 family)
MILVTGATGKVGSETVRLLADAGRPARAFVRDPRRAAFGPGVGVAVGDLDDPATIDAAMDGVDVLVLVSPSVPAQEIAVVDVAARRGVGHVVKVTNHRATDDSPVPRRRDHAAIEAHLRSRGLSHTLLAPNLFMQNLLAFAPEIRETDGFRMSSGDGRSGMVDARDVAGVAAAVAAAPEDHAGRTILLTGPELLSYDDVARDLGEARGRPVEHRRITPAEHRDAMVRAGVPEQVAASNAQVFGLVAEGDTVWLSDEVEAITGRPPRTLRAFAAEHAEVFR